jgi:PAS domain S-box-containing protein
VQSNPSALDELSRQLADARERAREHEARFEMLFSQNVNGVFFMTFDEPIRWGDSVNQEVLLDYAFEHLRVTAANKVVCEQLGAPLEELLGTAPHDRWWGDRTKWREHMRQLYNQGHVHHSVRAPRSDGTWFDVEGEYYCTYNEEGLLTGHCGIQRDVTERKQLQARVVASERLVALGTLAAGVGHEVNNPLTYIVLNLSLIERELAALESDASRGFGRIRTMVEQARYGTDRVGAIVRDLQSLTRAPDRMIVVDPVPILGRCLQIAEHQTRHRARVICEFGAIPPVRSTEDRLVQVFVNLIVNAAQAIPEGAADRYWIRVVSSTAPDGRAVVEVSDNGRGIAESDVNRIYDPFFTTKVVGEGTGLGLTICRSIVIGMGGDIEVVSAPDRGTTFRVLIPAAQLAETDSVPPGNATNAAVGLRILVIDDEPMIGQLVKSVLDTCDVVTETSARAVIDRLRAGETFDRILCDLMMPEITGMDFYEQLGEIAPELRSRIVFLTGGAFTDRARRFLERVPNRKLHKPFDVDELAAALVE